MEAIQHWAKVFKHCTSTKTEVVNMVSKARHGKQAPPGCLGASGEATRRYMLRQ